MKRALTLIASLLFALSLGAQEVVKVGVICSLSGNNASSGEQVRDAVKYFEGTLAGKPLKNRYSFILEDDQLTPRLTAQAANKLINIDHVNALMTISAGPGNVVGPLAQSKGVLHFGLSNDAKIVAGEYNFINSTSALHEAEATLKLFLGAGSKKVAIIGVRQQGVIVLTNALKPMLAEHGIAYFEEDFNPGERDFRMLLTKAAEQKPDAIYYMAFPPECQILLNQQKQLGLDKLFTTTTVTFDYLSDKSPAEGLFYASVARGTPEFSANYQKAMGHAPTFLEPFVIDSLSLIVEGFENAPSPSAAAAAKYLSAKREALGVIGPLTISPEGVVDSMGVLYQIRNGASVEVSADEFIKLYKK